MAQFAQSTPSSPRKSPGCNSLIYIYFPRCGPLHFPIARRTDRWRPDNSRGHYGPQHGTRDHTRSSGGRSTGHDRSRGRSAAGENRRGQRGRSRERSILTQVRPSRRPTPSEIRDRSMRRERSRSREQPTFSQHSSRRGATSLRQSETRHTPDCTTGIRNKK